MKEYSNKNDAVVKKTWTIATIEAICDILDSNIPEEKKTARQYRLTRKYNTMELVRKEFWLKKEVVMTILL